MTDQKAPSLLGRALRRHRRLLVPAIALMCLWQLCEALVPVAIGLVIDHAILPLSVPTLVVALVGVAVLFTVLSLSYRFGARLVNRAVNVESHTLRVQVAAHALNPRGTRTPLLPGEVLSIASADADGASYFLRQLAATCAAAVGVLVSTTYLFLTDWVVGVVIMVGVVLTLLGVQVLSPVISRATEHRQAQIAAASGQATDLMRGLRVIKGIGGEAAARERYARVNRRARDAGIATTTGVAAMEGLGQLLLGLLVAVVIVVAGLRTIGGHLSTGELIAVVGVATFVAEPMGLVAAISAALAQSRASARRITAYLATEPLLPDGDEPTGSDRLLLQFRGFATGADRPLDLSVGDRELVAVVTDDARTSSALAAAVSGSLSDYTGTILVGGTDRRRLSVTSASRTLAVAPHHADVFEGTIAANIAPGSTVTQDDLADVLAASACAELVGLFDEGLDHELQAGGTNLSGGQRQRIALARALYADRPLLVLDDPTTAVDAVTEAEIARRLRSLRRSTDPDAPRATVVLTSSPAFLAAADRVVMISSGADPVIGAHAELMIDSAAYRELVSR